MPHTESVMEVKDSKVSIAVVGAGVVGLCTALEAQRKGYQVTLFDRDEPGLGASFGNAGYLATELIEPLSNPQTLRSAIALLLNPNGPLSLPLPYLHRITPWLVRFILAAKSRPLADSRKGLMQLNKTAVAAWKRCLDDIGASEQIVKSGYMLVWESSSKRHEALQHQRWLSENGIVTELVEGATLAEREPALVNTVSHALFFPDAYRVREPYELCVMLFSVFMARGGHFVQQEITAIEASAGEVALCRFSDKYRYANAIICTGAWSKQLLQSVGLSVPLEAERGYHLTIPEAGKMLNNSIGSAERKFVMGPLDSGLRVVGISQLGGLQLGPFKHCFDILRHHSRKLLPGLSHDSLSDSAWMGHRPTLPDSLPVIDRHPQYPHLLFAFGHQHLGLTQAAVTAELVVQLLRNEESEIDLTLYRVNRF